MKNTIILFAGIFLFCTSLNCQISLWSKKANPEPQSINSISFRTDGKKVLTGTNCHPAYIRMFDTSSSLDWNFLVGNSFMCIMGVTFSSNGKYIAAIEEFGNIFIFDNSGSIPVIVDTIKTGTSYGFSTAISPDNTKLAVGCSNGKLLLYDLESRSLIKSINAHPSWVTTVCFSNSNSLLLSGGDDDKIKVWNYAGVIQKTFSSHTDDITRVRISSNDSFIYSSAKDSKIKVWNIHTGGLMKTLSGHKLSVNDIDLSPNGLYLTSVSADSTAKIWDINLGDEKQTFGLKDSGKLMSVCWSPAGDKIATGSEKSDLTLWKISDNQSKYSILTESLPTIGGSVVGTGNYKLDTTITITATPNQDYKFVNWTENKVIVSSSQVYSFKVQKDRILVANFSKTNFIHSNEKMKIEIYPNPVNEYILIANLESNKIYQVLISDLCGKQWVNQDLNHSKKIDIRDLPKGLYFLVIDFGNTIEKLRFEIK